MCRLSKLVGDTPRDQHEDIHWHRTTSPIEDARVYENLPTAALLETLRGFSEMLLADPIGSKQERQMKMRLVQAQMVSEIAEADVNFSNFEQKK